MHYVIQYENKNWKVYKTMFVTCTTQVVINVIAKQQIEITISKNCSTNLQYFT